MPTVRTADVGTVVTPIARARTICTVASDPEKGPSPADWMPMVTGYVVVEVVVVPSTPMPVTVPTTVVALESGVTSACWPTFTFATSVTGTVVATW